MLWFILFVLGLAFGSFFNVVALRYDGERFVFDDKKIGGRSHCPHCKNTLRWFELIPVVSFVIQGGKCRHCGEKISAVYPAVEIITALIFAFVPLRLMFVFAAAGVTFGTSSGLFWVLAALWIAAFSLFILMSYIDIRLGIIPDELTIFLAVIAIALFVIMEIWSVPFLSFLAPYAAIFGFQDAAFPNHIFALLFGLLLFGGLVIITRGRGMGLGDVKLAPVIGFLFGWPDILFVATSAFIIGAVVGIVTIFMKKKR